MYDVIIIGAGCAGLTAAVYVARANKSVRVFEGMTVGGQIASSPKVENYPSIKEISGIDFSMNLFNQACDFGAKLTYEQVTGLKVNEDGTKTVITTEGEYSARSVIIATGVKHKKLGLEKEDELTGMGVSYCAVCDGAFYKGRDVAVAGGGNTALGDAIYLSSYCRRVYLIHRRDEFRADSTLVERAKKIDNIEFVLSSETTELLGEDMLKGILVRDKKSGEVRKLDVEGIFVAIGHSADNEVFRNVVMLDEWGFVVAGEDCKTNVPGIFAAGDCRTKEVRQLTTAAADGSIAGIAASK